MVGDQLDMGLLARAAFKVAPPPHELPNKPPPIYIPARVCLFPISLAIITNVYLLANIGTYESE